MKSQGLWLFETLNVLCSVICAMLLLPTFALSATVTNSSDQVLPRNQLHLVQQRECSQRVGPFATQDTAWQRLQQAKTQGHGVSGVFPCYDGYGARGYCFNVFFPC